MLQGIGHGGKFCKETGEQRLKDWERIHNHAMDMTPESDLYTSLEKLHRLAEGKLDFCVGDSAKYRFAKLLSLQPEYTNTAILLNSAEENTAIILKTLEEAYQDEIKVEVKRMDLDFEHQK